MGILDVAQRGRRGLCAARQHHWCGGEGLEGKTYKTWQDLRRAAPASGVMGLDMGLDLGRITGRGAWAYGLSHGHKMGMVDVAQRGRRGLCAARQHHWRGEKDLARLARLSKTCGVGDSWGHGALVLSGSVHTEAQSPLSEMLLKGNTPLD